MSLSPVAGQTKYALLAEILREQIAGAQLLPGDRLPSFGEMRVQYGAALATVDRALGILEKDGLIVRVNGSGVFVADPGPSQSTKESQKDAEKPLLGLILPNCQGEFFSPIIKGVENESREAGYHLIVANSLGDHALEAQLLRQLAAQTVGMVVMACGIGNQAAFATLLERRTPFVLIDRRVEGLDVDLVATDNERGGYLATRHLLESGCHRVYAVGETAERASSLRERLLGFRRALTDSTLPFDGSLVRLDDDEPTRLGYLLASELLDQLASSGRERHKIGIFALNESTARGCYMAIKERGLKIPQDVAVVGFDDATAPLFDPPLSAVRQDLTGMGSESVRRLLELIRVGGATKPRQTRLQPELVVRNSSDPQSGFCSITHLLGNRRPTASAFKSFSPLVSV